MKENAVKTCKTNFVEYGLIFLWLSTVILNFIYLFLYLPIPIRETIAIEPCASKREGPFSPPIAIHHNSGDCFVQEIVIHALRVLLQPPICTLQLKF